MTLFNICILECTVRRDEVEELRDKLTRGGQASEIVILMH